MQDRIQGVWVLCQSRYDELVVIYKKEYDYWVSLYPQDYTFIAEGKHAAMKLIQKLMRESTC